MVTNRVWKASGDSCLTGDVAGLAFLHNLATYDVTNVLEGYFGAIDQSLIQYVRVKVKY
jgi:hypothetical protein